MIFFPAIGDAFHLAPLPGAVTSPRPSLIPVTCPSLRLKSSNGSPLSIQEDEAAWYWKPKCSLCPSLPDQFLPIP